MSIIWFSDLKGHRHGVNTDHLMSVGGRSGGDVFFRLRDGEHFTIDADIDVIEAAIEQSEPKFGTYRAEGVPWLGISQRGPDEQTK